MRQETYSRRPEGYTDESFTRPGCKSTGKKVEKKPDWCFWLLQTSRVVKTTDRRWDDGTVDQVLNYPKRVCYRKTGQVFRRPAFDDQ